MSSPEHVLDVDPGNRPSGFTLERFLALDSDECLNIVTVGKHEVPVWLLIRSRVFRTLLQKTAYADNNLTKSSRGIGTGGIRGKLRVLRVLLQSLTLNVRKLSGKEKKYPILIMCTGSRLERRGERYYNPLCEHLLEIFPEKTALAEDIYGWRWPFPRATPNILIQTPWRLQGKLHGRLFRKVHLSTAKTVLERANVLLRKLGLPILLQSELRQLVIACAEEMASLAWRIAHYEGVFGRLGVRLLIREEAYYGTADNVAAIVAARNLGVVTAEYQHGAISKGHEAYNYGDAALVSMRWKKSLPDYLLTWGSWWSEQVAVPGEVVEIGYPITHSKDVIVNERIKKILLLGDGFDTEKMLAVARQLQSELGEKYDVVFRPHPLERYKFQPPKNIQTNLIRIDAEAKIEETAIGAHAVIGELSTGLFDALGLADRVLMCRTEKSRICFPVTPFEEVEDWSSLGEAISEGKFFERTILSPQIRKENWQSAYREFVLKIIDK